MLQEIAATYKTEFYNELAKIGKCFSSEKRLEVLHILSQGPKTVETLSRETGMSAANTSRHLQVLKEGRLVISEKRGNYVVYTVAGDKVRALVRALCVVGETQLSEITRIREQYSVRTSDVYTITLEEAWRRLQRDEITLVDLRPSDEYRAGHMEKAESIPLSELESRLSGLSRQKDIVVYCRGRLCAYADLAAHFLTEQGFKAYSLNRSYADWQAFRGVNKH